jgi:OOP family OmpA-OmpF porin
MAINVKRIIPSVKQLCLASVLSLSLTSCSMYKLEELRHTTPAGTPFQNELSRLYMDYSTSSEKGYDWSNSWYFADKGLMLAYGKDAGPEELEKWDIPEAVRPELEKARLDLLAVLTPDNIRVSPSKAAEAQFYFDCWVKEQEQNWREEQIANCKDNLTRLMFELHSPNSKRYNSQLPAEAPKPKKVTKPAVVEKPKEITPEPVKTEANKEQREPVAESTSYAVFFEPDKAEVSEPGMNVITEVIKSLRESSDYSVILHNSKDHPGKAAERIAVIKKLLVAGGVKESAVRIGLGKTEVESGKTSTRRVEIFLNE